MTSSGLSEDCPKCGGPASLRPAASQPVLYQLLFGTSFVLYLIFSSQLAGHKQLLWGWTALQVGLGIALVRGRLRAGKRVLRCVRCDVAIR